MDKEQQDLLETIALNAASEAVVKLREFHQDDLQVLGERIDIGFAKVERELQETNMRLDRVENALSILLQEFTLHQEKEQQLEAQIRALTERVIVLEKQLSYGS